MKTVVWYEYVGNVAQSFNLMIRDNNGKYLSEKQAEFLESFAERTADIDMFDIKELEPYLELKKEYGKYNTLVMVTGTYNVGNFRRVPVAHVYVTDFEGVIAKYKTQFVRNETLELGWELFDFKKVWERVDEDENVGISEQQGNTDTCSTK